MSIFVVNPKLKGMIKYDYTKHQEVIENCKSLIFQSSRPHFEKLFEPVNIHAVNMNLRLTLQHGIGLQQLFLDLVHLLALPTNRCHIWHHQLTGLWSTERQTHIKSSLHIAKEQGWHAHQSHYSLWGFPCMPNRSPPCHDGVSLEHRSEEGAL